MPLNGETKDYGALDAQAPGKHPIGLGIRTPAIIVSPWSRGGFVCSELFDHTSVLQFVEKRFGVQEPNISAWRRSVCGDLISVFDFSESDRAAALKLPTTDDFRERIAQSLAGPVNMIPPTQAPATQMPGQRPHRPLPYKLDVIAGVTPERRLRIEMINRGAVGAAFTVHDNSDAQEPWHYTIGAGDRFASEQWHDAGPLAAYDLTLRGPNGLWRRFAGSLAVQAPRAEVVLLQRPSEGELELLLRNGGSEPMVFAIALDGHYPAQGARTRRISVAPGKQVGDIWRLATSDHWYDLTVTLVDDAAFLRRFAGKVETGHAGRTDPGIGPMRVTA